MVVIQFSHFSRSHIFPSFRFWFSMSFFFATFPAHTFSLFSHCAVHSFFLYCHVSDFPRWIPNDFPIVSSLFIGGGRAQIRFRHSFAQVPLDIRPHRPSSNRQEHQTSSWTDCTHNIPYQTSDIRLYTHTCYTLAEVKRPASLMCCKICKQIRILNFQKSVLKFKKQNLGSFDGS